jgi:hypothetical protein
LRKGQPCWQAARLGQPAGAFAQGALEFDAAARSVERGRKLGEHVVAGCVDHAPPVPLDALREDLAGVCERADRGPLVVGEQARVARCIGREDGGEAMLKGCVGHGAMLTRSDAGRAGCAACDRLA